MKHALHSAICILTAASIAVFPFHPAMGAAATSPPGAEEMEKQVEELGRRSEALRGALKRERFDPEARVDASDYDLDTLVDFVRDEIAFHPYAGTMRGAAGTLRAGAGNSLDQALLLGQMIRTAGFDARIVRADLPDDLARRLLDVSDNAPAPEPLDHLGEAIRRTFDETEVSPADARPVEETRHYRDAQRHAQALLAVLDDAGVDLTPADATGRLLEKVRSYFWVQYRDGPTGEWQQAHPAFGAAEPPGALEPAEFFAESIPDTYQHQFTMTAWIEQRVGGKIEKHGIMQPWTAPVANLNGVAIRFQNVPDGISRDNLRHPDEVLAATNTLMPFVGEAPAAGGMAFDLQGRAIDPMAQGGSAAAGIIKTVGDKFITATEGMADDPDGLPAMALHSMYLEFTFQRPGGESETRRRYVLPPRDTYDEDRNEVLRQLITGYTYMVSPGGQSREYITDRFIEGTVDDLEWLKWVVLHGAAPEQERKLPEKPLSAFPTLYQQWAMERLPVEDGVVRFRGEPALVGIREGYRDANTVFSEADVVWNAVEAVRRSDDGWVTAPRAALAAGVWDTVLESIPFGGPSAANATLVSTPTAFDLAREQNIELLVLKPAASADAALGALALDEQQARFVRRDLEAGYAVVIPSRTPERSPMAAWWRVDPGTGETLGMLGDGYGATATEYILVLTVVALGLATAMKATTEYYECEQQSGIKARLCCALEKHLSLVGEEAEGDEAVDKSGDAMLKMLCD